MQWAYCPAAYAATPVKDKRVPIAAIWSHYVAAKSQIFVIWANSVASCSSTPGRIGAKL